ncbi:MULTISPECIES: beta-galactosidase [unclassified Leclercia]|uniref:Beta-galactosidase n=1 Tax=Leclercia barmai TaxID=2785629 RepID=A0ABS7RS55_9ENTR|nr:MULTISPECIES: beta-galactosidase [unclassified Leclercia]MBZ0056917.1 beta-galactosidase [Leclercia sp. EMC7]MCM5698743.1 beta-galactosidase [Leclercia sp. LTM14]
MSRLFPQLNLLHGADYNPDQWLNQPDILEKDIAMMKETKCNVMSVGIFSWSKLEPAEGQYQFDWLDNVLDKLYSNGIYVFLATPSGAKPAWVSEKYPAVLRTNSDLTKNLHGERHNHCPSSPDYLRLTKNINQQLAQRYAHHPAVLAWHISNEYGGECHCDTCQHAFRDWLKNKYQTLENLNQRWWSSFWSHEYSAWSQIHSPGPKGEQSVHALNIDWRRFVSEQVALFCRHEIQAVKAYNPRLPATTNFHGDFYDYDYWRLAREVDFISWDSYPQWHKTRDQQDIAAYTAFTFDLMRSLKSGLPFLLMESTPGTTNWQPISKLKKPGMHLLSAMQAVAHGSDSVQYFQWRKSRGSVEKLHGAVVDHVGHLNTRVGQDVKQVGAALEKIAHLAGAGYQAEVALVYDWDNRWAVNDAAGPRNGGIKFEETVQQHYQALWQQSIPVDIVSQQSDLSAYRVLIAPMLYMVDEAFAERVNHFVAEGGVFIATYWTGIVNPDDLCFTTGFPGPLRQVLGIWSEEIDSLYDGETNHIDITASNWASPSRGYVCRELCDLIHAETADVLAVYQQDFYACRPAITCNRYGNGQAYYLAARTDADCLQDFYRTVADHHGLAACTSLQLPEGVVATARQREGQSYIVVQNYSDRTVTLDLAEENRALKPLLRAERKGHQYPLSSFGVEVFLAEA